MESLLGRDSIIMLDGPPHLHRRRLMMPSFRGDHMAGFCQAIESITESTIDHWPRDRVFSFHHEMQTITLETILHTVFGLQRGARLDQIRDLLRASLEQVSHPAFVFVTMLVSSEHTRGLSGAIARLRRFTPLSRVDALVYEQIADYRRHAADRPTNILKTLMSARDENGEGLSDEDLHGQLMSLFVAGYETTAGALCWLFQHLLTQPEVLTRVHGELADVIGDGALEPQHIAKLRYLEAVIHESMRLQPLMPVVVRYTREPVTVASVALPKGVFVAPSAYLVQRRADLWEDPQTFRPERFLDARIDPYTFLPFGGGVRRCMGQAFAMHEMKVVTATVLRRVRLTLPRSYTAQPTRRAIAWVPSKGTPVQIASDQVRPIRRRSASRQARA